MKIKTVTSCPTCGSECRIGGDDKEGTHYYVPIVNAALLEAAKFLLKIVREWDDQSQPEELAWIDKAIAEATDIEDRS